MTKIADFDFLKLPNLILRKNPRVTKLNLDIFNTFEWEIFSKNQNSEPPK